MLARWNGEGEFESIFKKKGVSVSDEANNIFGRIESLDEFNMPINAEEWDKWAKSIKLTDDSLKKFLTTKDEAYQTKDLATYTQYLKDQNKTLDIAAVKTKALAFAKNMAINAGIAFASFLVSKGIQALVDWANRAEIAREKSTELTKAWSEENSSIDSSISKYKQLKESLDSGTLSTQEIANAKNELAEIQDTLTRKYGQEALGIDLVNGKYDEQIKKLDELSRKKAEDYTAENYANIQEDIKYVNNSVKVDEELGSGAVFNPDTYNKYLKKYLDEYDALTTRVTDRNGIVGSSGLNIVGEGTREEIYNQLTSLFNDLSRDFGEDNPDVNKLKTALSGIISDSFDTEKMEQAKSNIKQYAEAQILSQNNTRQLYEDAINAVDNYNKALASGQGVEEAKANLDEVKQKVADNTSGISGAGQVFEDVWGGISEGAKTTSENVNKMTVSLSEWEGVSDKIKSVSNAFKEFSDDGYLSVKTINELKTATGLSDDDFKKYKKTLLDVKKGSSEFNKIMSEMTFRILENALETKDLTSVTEEEIAAVLRENGVTNASTVAHYAKQIALQEEKIAAAELNGLTEEEIKSLLEEANASEFNKACFYAALESKIKYNATHIENTDDINKLLKECEMVGALTGMYGNLGLVKSYSDAYKKNVANGKTAGRILDGQVVTYNEADRWAKKYGKSVKDLPYFDPSTLANMDFSKLNIKMPKVPIPDFGSVGGKGSGSDSKPSYEDPTDAIINRINLRAKELELQEESIKNALEIAEIENNYNKQISLTNDLIANRKERVKELELANKAFHNAATILRNSNPWDEDLWFDSQSNATEAYYNVYNSASKDEQEKIKTLFDSLSKYKKAYADNAEQIISLNKEILQSEKDIVSMLNDALDGLQNAYTAVNEAMIEQNKYGEISVDTLQSLLELEPQYINMLMDENGNLQLNEEKVRECTAAYIDNLSAKTALNLIDSVSALTTEREQLELLGSTALDTAQDIWALVDAQMALLSGSLSGNVMSALSSSVAGIRSMGESAKRGLAMDGLNSFAMAEKANEIYENLAEAHKTYNETVSDANKDFAEKEKQFAENMAEAWEKENLERLKDGLAKQEDILNRYRENIELIDFGIDLVDESDFETNSELLTKKVEQLTNYGSAMKQEFERVLNIIPQTADEAQAIADRISQLGDNMRDNISTLRETKVAIQKLRIDALSSAFNDSTSAMESELDNIDRRLQILRSDNKDDFKYTQQILSMNATLPSFSEFSGELKQKQRINKQLIKEEQATQDKINDIVTKALEMQAEENAKMREKERQKLIEDMAKAREDLADSLSKAREQLQDAIDDATKQLSELHGDYEELLKGSEAATSETLENIQKLISESKFEFPEPDIKNIEDVFLQIFEMIDETQLKLDELGNKEKPANNVETGMATSDKISIDSIPFKSYAKGTGGHPGGLALVGDENWLKGWNKPSPELAIYPDGSGEILGKNGAEIRNLPKGTQVLPAKSTKDLLGKIPSYANGTTEDLDAKRKEMFELLIALGADESSAIARANEELSRIKTPPEYQKIVDAIEEKTIKDFGEDYKKSKYWNTIRHTIPDSDTWNNLVKVVEAERRGEVWGARINEDDLYQRTADGVPLSIFEADGLKYFDYYKLDPYYGEQALKAQATHHAFSQEVAYAFSDNPDALRLLYAIVKDGKVDAGISIPAEYKKAVEDYFALFSNIGRTSNEIPSQEHLDKMNDLLVNFVDFIKNSESALWIGDAFSELGEYVPILDNVDFKDLGGYFYIEDGVASKVFTNKAGKEIARFKKGMTEEEISDNLAKIMPYAKQVVHGVDAEGRLIANYSGLYGAEGSNWWADGKGTLYSKGMTHTKVFKMDGEEVRILPNDKVEIPEEYQKWWDEKYKSQLDFSGISKDSQIGQLLENLGYDVGKIVDITDEALGDGFTLDDISQEIKKGINPDLKDVQSLREDIESKFDRIGSELRVNSEKIYNNDELTDNQKYRHIFDLTKNSTKEANEEATKSYKQVREALFEYIDRFKANPEEMDKEVFDSYIELLDEIGDYVWNSESAQAERRAELVGILDEQIAAIDKRIEDERLFWGNDNRDILSFTKEKIRLINIALEDGTLTAKEYGERLRDYLHEYYNVLKDTVTKELELNSSRLGSLKTLLESYHNITNSIREERHEIQKELDASMTMAEYLDEDTRIHLFNEDDAKVLLDVLKEIENEAADLKLAYEIAISESTVENLSQITNEYSMQYDLLMKRYNISKAELEVVKKKQKLDNVLNERNVRMFVNGSWQWVANTQDVIDAKSELADAEYAKNVEEAGLVQQESINNLTRSQDELNVTISELNNGVIELDEVIERVKDSIGGIPDAIMSLHANIKDYATLNKNYSGGSSETSSNVDFDIKKLYEANDYAEGIEIALKNNDLKSALKANELRNAKIDALDLSVPKWDNELIVARANGTTAEYIFDKAVSTSVVDEDSILYETWWTKKAKQKLASGSKDTKSGWTALGEIEDEIFITQNGRLIPINQPTFANIGAGGIVFNQQQLQNLRSLWDLSNMQNLAHGIISHSATQPVEKTIDNRIIINGMTVDTGSEDGKILANALKRYVGNH